MSIVKHETSRGQSETDTLADAKAMYAAASADADVKAHLGPKYLGEMKSEIEELESLSAGKATIKHEKLADGARVLDLSSHLLDVMKDIRDMAAGDVDDVTARTLGRGAAWKAEEPVKLAADAHAMALFLHARHDVEKAIHLDKQHAHDLAHLADAITQAHAHHTSLLTDLRSDTHARRALVSSLQARSHHIRVKARLAHRHDAGKMAAFKSPVAHHAVHHRASAAAQPAS